MEKEFKRSFDSLEGIFEFVAGFFEARGIGGKHLRTVQFAVEEVFTNMVKYNRGGRRDILLGLEKNGQRLEIRLTDFDVPPFDITRAPDVDVSLPLDKRKPGGLGIHLVKKMVDGVEYEYSDGRSTTIILKDVD